MELAQYGSLKKYLKENKNAISIQQKRLKTYEGSFKKIRGTNLIRRFSI